MIGAVCVIAPDVPCTVSKFVDGVVATVVVIVRTDDAFGVIGFVPNAALVPCGRPEMERLTGELKPFDLVTLTVYVMLLP